MQSKELLATALALTIEERVELAVELLDSIDEHPSVPDDSALAKVEERLRAIDSGAPTVAHDEAMAQLRRIVRQ